MPSERILKEKKKIVEELTEKLKSQSGVFVDYKGITVNEDTEMRVKLREANIDYTVIKNTLMRFAIKNVGFDALDPILHGTTSLAISDDDPIAPARIIREYADKMANYFEIKAGFMDGKVLSADEVNALARIPALPVLQAQLLGTMLAPITSLAIVLKAIAEKGGIPADTEVKADAPEKAPEETPAAKEPEPELAEAVPAEEPTAEVSAAEESKAVEAAAEEAPAVEEAPAADEVPAVEEAPAVEAAEEKPEPVEAAQVEEPAVEAAAVDEAATTETVEEKPKAAAKPRAKKADAEKETAKEATEEKAEKAPAKPRAKKTETEPTAE